MVVFDADLITVLIIVYLNYYYIVIIVVSFPPKILLATICAIRHGGEVPLPTAGLDT